MTRYTHWRDAFVAWLARPRVRENLAAVALCLIVIAVVILSADLAPQWIYQGF